MTSEKKEVVYCRVTPQELALLNTWAGEQSRSRNNYVTIQLVNALEDGLHTLDVEVPPAKDAVALFLRLPAPLKKSVVAAAKAHHMPVNRYVRAVLFG